ncbi:UDP-N-acetylmuramoylalanyl-D-glutamyl-2, 6-diaminopimelate--D-alanyl-D-alanine ligase [Borrelia turicatae]|uniref:UDP-N-acetylmuramoylalanyl-D-glutamyl-2, 6-diaminopimelate--D-alanyl-D-alanine ligase n=1 Tax=Borrelia turicatae TaxID=142 RepID=A0A172XAU3_BORTU|nr:UDP-N-acetylmuramoyl-tripeptide--D-alanyl-D-alanine ligase [Borrelia turicatae]ANF33795.1 UDP-N-acetylmuramoylalanyl-D-glutamyl-2, 6-diaminopimelate--D-alanyl-D-alanine ligase [Borrelia turicatae]UPA14648.1 UDP-N-acetylmuramoyl-tripeptide--D-alanyl-D-alanine ligase [Borrelia turicatae]
MHIKIEDILDSLKDIKFVGYASSMQKIVSFYSLDSREINAKNSSASLYFAYKGDRVDGFSFVEYLIDIGVKCFVCSKDCESLCLEYLNRDENLVFLLTSNVVIFLQNLAACFITRTSFKRIAITGSNGKTTTKEMLYSILSERYKTCKTWGNLNSDIGLPLSILRTEGDEEYAVFEVGISYIGEMNLLAEILNPEIVIVTNISYAHMQAFEDLEIVTAEKGKIMTKSTQMVILNESCPYHLHLRVMAKSINPGINIFYFDFHSLQIRSFAFVNDKFFYDFTYKGFDYSILLPGQHNIFNAISCIHLALLLGLSENEIRNGLLHADFQKGRAELLRVKDYLILNDSYNGNLGSFMALKEMILGLEIKGKKFIILGAFKELGKFAYEVHKTAIREVVLMNFDKGFLIGEEFQEVKKIENLTLDNLFYFSNFENFIDYFVKNLESECFIAIKGSRSNRLERILDYL